MSAISGLGAPSAAALSEFKSKVFNKADGNGSGGLDATEFKQLASQGPLAKAGGTRDVEADFKAFDTDGSGELSQAELDQGLEQTKPQQNAASLFSDGSTSGLNTLLQALQSAQSSSVSSGTSKLDSLKQLLAQLGVGDSSQAARSSRYA